MNDVWTKEPALVIAFVQAALVLAIAFGAHLTQTQTTAIVAFATAALAVAAGFVTRSQVTPSAAPNPPVAAPPAQ